MNGVDGNTYAISTSSTWHKGESIDIAKSTDSLLIGAIDCKIGGMHPKDRKRLQMLNLTPKMGGYLVVLRRDYSGGPGKKKKRDPGYCIQVE